MASICCRSDAKNLTKGASEMRLVVKPRFDRDAGQGKFIAADEMQRGEDTLTYHELVG